MRKILIAHCHLNYCNFYLKKKKRKREYIFSAVGHHNSYSKTANFFFIKNSFINDRIQSRGV